MASPRQQGAPPSPPATPMQAVPMHAELQVILEQLHVTLGVVEDAAQHAAPTTAGTTAGGLPGGGQQLAQQQDQQHQLAMAPDLAATLEQLRAATASNSLEAAAALQQQLAAALSAAGAGAPNAAQPAGGAAGQRAAAHLPHYRVHQFAELRLGRLQVRGIYGFSSIWAVQRLLLASPPRMPGHSACCAYHAWRTILLGFAGGGCLHGRLNLWGGCGASAAQPATQHSSSAAAVPPAGAQRAQQQRAASAGCSCGGSSIGRQRQLGRCSASGGGRAAVLPSSGAAPVAAAAGTGPAGSERAFLRPECSPRRACLQRWRAPHPRPAALHSGSGTPAGGARPRLCDAPGPLCCTVLDCSQRQPLQRRAPAGRRRQQQQPAPASRLTGT